MDSAEHCCSVGVISDVRDMGRDLVAPNSVETLGHYQYLGRFDASRDLRLGVREAGGNGDSEHQIKTRGCATLAGFTFPQDLSRRW